MEFETLTQLDVGGLEEYRGTSITQNMVWAPNQVIDKSEYSMEQVTPEKLKAATTCLLYLLQADKVEAISASDLTLVIINGLKPHGFVQTLQEKYGGVGTFVVDIPEDTVNTANDSLKNTQVEWVRSLITLQEKNVEHFNTVMGFISIILLRMLAKTPESVVEYLKKRFHGVFTNLFSGIKVKSFTLDIDIESLKLIAEDFNKSSLSALRALKLLLNVYQNCGESSEESALSMIIKAGALVHLEYNGMSVIKHLLEVLSLSDVPLVDFFGMTDLLTYRTTLTRLVTVFKEYLIKKGEKKTLFPWCRIINDDYHSDLASKENQHYLRCLCYLLFHLDPTKHKDIWKAKPFGTMPSFGTVENQYLANLVNALRDRGMQGATKIARTLITTQSARKPQPKPPSNPSSRASSPTRNTIDPTEL